MIVTAQHDLDTFKTNLTDVMMATDGLEYDSIEYVNNTDLSPYRFRRFRDSRARYLLSRAESNNKLSTVQQHVDPVCLHARATKKISTGLLTSHRHYVDIYALSITRIENVAEGADPGPELHEQKIEFLAEFCDNDHENPMDYYWGIVSRFID